MKTDTIIQRLEAQGYRVMRPPEWFCSLRAAEQEALCKVGLHPANGDIFFRLRQLSASGQLDPVLENALIDAGVMLD